MATVNSPSPAKLRQGKAQRRKILTWIVVLAVLIGGYFLYSKLKGGDKTPQMITAVVQRGDIQETVTATGSIEAQTGAQVNIGSQITGQIKKLYADIGQKLKKGDIIAELDLPELQDTLNESKAAYSAAQVKTQQASVTLEQTRKTVYDQLSQAQATMESMRQKYYFARSNAQQSKETVPTDILRAQNTLNSNIAALNTAKATLNQTQAGAALNVQVATAALTQANATADKSDADLVRNQNLYNQQFLSASDLDTAIANAKVNRAAADSAKQNLALTQQKVDADLSTAKDAVTQAQQNVEAARSALKAALAEHHTVSAQAANTADAYAGYVEAQAAVAVAKANLQNVRLREQDLEQDKQAELQSSNLVAYNTAILSKSIIRSPIDGSVINLAVQQGDTLAAGLAAPTLIVVSDLNRLEVEAYVDETDIGKIKLGQPVQLSVDAFPQQTFTGTVLKIASGSTIQQGVVTYDVSVKLDKQNPKFKPDMTASATFIIGSQTNVLLVPSVAIQVGTKGSKVNVLKTVDGEKKIVSVSVKTGGTDGLNTEVLSGLNEGDVVVVAGGITKSRGGGSNPFTSSGGGSKRGG